MFQHFTFTHKNNATSDPSPLPTNDAEINNTETTSTPTNVILDTSVGTTTPETETMIVGHKLSYAHEASNERHEEQTALSHNTSNDDQKNHVINHDEEDEGSLLSVEVDDLSGSILDNLPSTNHGNDNVDSSIDDDIVNDNKMEANISDPAFFFEPIVQAMQALQHEGSGSTALFEQLKHYEDDADDEMLQLAPSLQRRAIPPKHVSPHTDTVQSTHTPTMAADKSTNIPVDSTNTIEPKNGAKHATPGRFVSSSCFIVALIFLWWRSKYAFDTEMTASISTSEPMYISTNSETKSQSIPVPSPVFAIQKAEWDLVDNTPLLNIPTYMRITYSIEPTITKHAAGDMDDYEVKMDASSTPLAVTGPLVSWSDVQQIWLPHQLIDLIATIRSIPTFLHRLVSMIIYAATIAVTGCVFVLLLAKFAIMTWKKANVPEETTTNGGIKTSSSMVLFRDQTKTQPKFVNAKSLCEFLQSAQLSRTGRRSRSSTSTVLQTVYNLGCYEQLTKDDLKNIGIFLGIPKLSKLQQKADLINAVVVQYETSLQSINMSGIKEVLSVMNMNNIATTNKKDLVKVAIEVGF